MKIVYYEYSFDPIDKKVVLHNARKLSINFADILMITNITTNDIIYQPQIQGKGGELAAKGIASLELSLDYDTSSMGENDTLQILTNVPTFEKVQDLVNIIESNVTFVKDRSTDKVLDNILHVLIKIEHHLNSITDEEMDTGDALIPR